MKAESAFRGLADKRKWKIGKKGWPDFLCKSENGDWFAVEVKADGYGPTAEQVAVMDVLTELGLRCYLWTPSGGFLKHRVDRMDDPGGAA